MDFWVHDAHSFAVTVQDHHLSSTSTTPKPTTPKPFVGRQVLVRDTLPATPGDIWTQAIDSRLALLYDGASQDPLDAVSSLDFYTDLYSVPLQSRQVPRRSKSKPLPSKASPKMKKRRSSLQFLMHTLLPTTPPASATGGDQTPRSRANSSSNVKTVVSPLAAEFPVADEASASASGSPPLDFLLDEDPFANLISPVLSSRVPISSSASPPSPPETIPSVPLPRSPLMPDTEVTLARVPSAEAKVPKTRPRAISGARMQPQPAYQRPAFTPRPSLPSLNTLAKMNVVLTKKVKRGRVGAGLPFEPWDNPGCETPPRVMQDVNARDTESLPPGTQPLLPSQLLHTSSGITANLENSYDEVNSDERNLSFAPTHTQSHSLSSSSDSGHDVLDFYYSEEASIDEALESEFVPATPDNSYYYEHDYQYASTTATDLPHEIMTTTALLNGSLRSPPPASTAPFYGSSSSPASASLSRSISASSKSSNSSYGGADGAASPRQYQLPYHPDSYQQHLDFAPEAMDAAEYSRAAGFDDGGWSIYAGTMTTRSSSGDSDSLKSPPDSECHSLSSPFAFTSTSYFPPFSRPMASVDRVVSWRMSSQQGGGLGGGGGGATGSSNFLSDSDLSDPDPFFIPGSMHGFSGLGGGEHARHDVHEPLPGHPSEQYVHVREGLRQGLVKPFPPAQFVLRDPGSRFSRDFDEDSFGEGDGSSGGSGFPDARNTNGNGFLSPGRLGSGEPGARMEWDSAVGACPSSADTIRPVSIPVAAGAGVVEPPVDRQADLRVEYGHASSPRTPESGTGAYSDNEIPFLRAGMCRSGVEDGRKGGDGDGACVSERSWHDGRWQESGHGVDEEDGGDELGFGPELKREGFSSDLGTAPLMSSPVLDFDSNHYHSHTHHHQRQLQEPLGEMKRNRWFVPGRRSAQNGKGEVVDGAGREGTGGGGYHAGSHSTQAYGASSGYTDGYAASSTTTTGRFSNSRGRGGDDEDDGGDDRDRRRRLNGALFGHAISGATTSSSSAYVSDDDGHDASDDSADDYGHGHGHGTSAAGVGDNRSSGLRPPSSATSSRFPGGSSFPPRSTTSSDDDDIPLAQRIPTALTAQKSIRKQVREERDQRHARRERVRTAGESSDSAAMNRERERHTTLRPAGAGGPLLPPLALSSSLEAAFHATSGGGSGGVVPSSSAVGGGPQTRQRTVPVPINNNAPGPVFPISAEDLAQRLQNVQVSAEYQRQQWTSSSTAGRGHLHAGYDVHDGGGVLPRGSMENTEWGQTGGVPVTPGHSRGKGQGAGKDGNGGSPPSPPLAKSHLRPTRSFHRSGHHGAPMPADAEHKIAALSRQPTGSSRPQARSRGESVSAAASAAHSPVGRYRSLSVSKGGYHPPSGYDDSGAGRPPVPPLPSSSEVTTQHQHQQQQAQPRKLVKPLSLASRPSIETPENHRRPSMSSRSPKPPMSAGLPSLDKGQIVQQRVFIGDMQRFNMVELAPSTTAGDVVEMIEAQGSFKGIVGSGGWMVWEVAQDFGMERPIRSFELLADVQASWNKDKMVNLFVVKLTPLAGPLSRSAIPSSSPTHGGYVEWESKKGKWSKRWMSLREHCLWLSKRDHGKDEIVICSLSNFDAYRITRSHRAPKPFAFAVKSTDNLSYFENAADYLHTFSCSEKDGRVWTEKILIARSYVLHQERQVLFNPKAPGGNASGALSRSATTARKSASQRAPLISVPPPYNAQAHLSGAAVFEPGSLLHSQP